MPESTDSTESGEGVEAPPAGAEVTAAEIARLAGVGRAAVSNWRRRHAGFPRPVGGTATSPSFALAEVEAWLRSQGKLAELPLAERVWQYLSGHPEGAATALVRTGCVLLLAAEEPGVREAADAAGDPARALSDALAPVLERRFGTGDGRAVPAPEAAWFDAPTLTLVRAAAELAAGDGVAETYAFLLGRQLEAHPRQYAPTPEALAGLMAALAGPAPTVLDPACGSGGLLLAAEAASALHGQEADGQLAALTALRLALRPGGARAVDVRAADTLRADALTGEAADAVLCHPPFNERNWGHDALAYDPRWEYGLPARTESELAWVQHCLARLRDGGTAVLLMPPAAAARRSGRRVRADLLRRGALRAVVALPPGAAPPHHLPLHLWVLRRPGRERPATPEVLLADAGAPGTAAGEPHPPWEAVRATVLDAWRAFDRDGTLTEQPGVARSLPVIDLLDDDTDLTPARHLPPATAGEDGHLAEVGEEVAATLRRTLSLAPEVLAPPAASGRAPVATTVGELARTGALTLRSGTAVAAGSRSGARVVLTDHDVLTGAAPTATLAPGDPDPAPDELLREGDVVVPVLGAGGPGGGPGVATAARVVDAAGAGAALGRNLTLLRPDPDALDPWFLAGFLRATANHRQASSYASAATRLDVRRIRLPRLPLAEQREYGARFAAVAAFEESLRLAARLGGQLVQGLHDGLTGPALPPS
ncbi:hypothetical protein B591_10800 [Streptomyces sp. GBA 94-10 4N24]|uniref:N-6 DNA methylase n=1 Tax=unclassified Streptomyces TaxID=2593676 RepID=UPI0003C31FDC|nr:MULTISPECIES: N-6 DNA methylase [unclassified Streptomyces]ESQ00200.1 hypothetical protein B591_10800 [Streptomyces sp. GBA 94-10 4N24]ESQ06253.1 hypothetical protein B590_10925 [Streptomyces sp. PVA_94-07]UZN59152.1 hypothetical protein B591N_10800 [Streptomyces sp. GBA 94-10 4N24]